MKKHLPTLALLLVIFQAQSQPSTPTVTEPLAKSPEKAAQDLQTKVPLDLSKMGEPLPRNLFIELSKAAIDCRVLLLPPKVFAAILVGP